MLKVAIVAFVLGIVGASEARSADNPVPILPRLIEPRVLESRAFLGATCGDSVSGPTLLRQVAAEYSPVSFNEGIEGDVVVEAVISTTGELTRVGVLRSPNWMQSSAAVSACKNSIFGPATCGGSTVLGFVRILYSFDSVSAIEVGGESPSDSELDLLAGGRLAADAEILLSEVESVELFEICVSGALDFERRIREEETHFLQVREDYRGSPARLRRFSGVALSESQKRLVLGEILYHSPWWGSPDPARAFGEIPVRRYGMLLRCGGEELYLLFDLQRNSDLVLCSEGQFFGGGSPYRRTSKVLGQLVRELLKGEHLGLEW